MKKRHVFRMISAALAIMYLLFSSFGKKAGWLLGEDVHIGVITPLKVKNPMISYNVPKHGETVLSSIMPKFIVDLKSMKYLPVASMAARIGGLPNRQKRDTESEYVKVYPPVTSRQKPMVPTWATVQYNRRPIINTPWMKDTQGVAMTTMNNINGAMLELSDFDIQRETAKANLVLVQRMGELVQAEKEKVRSEIQRVTIEMERLIAEKERHQMDTQKLEIEKELIEAKLMSGSARSS